MGFKWTKRDLRDANITESKGYNAELDNYVGELNGGLDRDNLPSGPSAVAEPMFNDEAFHKFAVANPIRIDAALEPSYTAATQTAGTNFNNYTSGWHVHQDDDIEETWREGHLWVVFNTWFWQAKERGYTAGPPIENYRTFVQFRLLFNGAVIADTDRLFVGIEQVHLETVIPIPSGAGKIQIAWKISNETGLETSGAMRIFTFAGGKLVAINRYR